jgi:hypothetical protein
MIPLAAQSQDGFKPYFLGEDFLFYKGSLFIINPNGNSDYGHSFYASLDECMDSYSNKVIYPSAQYSFNTERDSLLNRVFRVDDIVQDSKSSWNPKIVFLLKDTLRDDTIYFVYDKKYEHSFPFWVNEIKSFGSEYIKSKFEKRVDDFTSEVTISTPILTNSEISPVILYKIIKNGVAHYYISLNTTGSTVNVGEKGVIVLFTDGTKWTRQTEIDVDASSRGFNYSAWITLTSSDLLTFQNKTIKGFKLYIYDEYVALPVAERFKAFVKEIKSMK